jgi:hypothetical protein
MRTAGSADVSLLDGRGSAGAPAGSAVPHCPQNLNGAGFSNPHCEHRLGSGAAQSPQNLMPSGFSNPHFGQNCTVQI